ncbi:sigma-54-dependent Fis family transcriptional regulator [Nakamurella sp.]|uniref:sigma-54-dependent Fis family transcriptional regulator n=1 Tax=Nakamurella sp. TaxID=1869182 RepID=UPI003B3A7CB1
MDHAVDRRLLIATARADFLEGAGSELRGVPDHIAASWRRSASRGVRPGEVRSTYYDDLDLGSRLMHSARPVLERLAGQLDGIPMCVALTDNQARLLARRDTSSWVGRLLDRVSFAQGFDFAEGQVGTNGVGTVLEFGESMYVVGAEHFVENLHAFACAGAPIRDPFTGRIEGVLDISCLADHATPIMHSLVRSSAAEIERNLLMDRNQAQQALFDAYTRVDARSRDAVLAVGPRVVMANPVMHGLVDHGDLTALCDHVRFVVGHRPTVDDRLELPSGRAVRLRGSTIAVGAEIAGMVAVVSLLHEAGEPPAPTAPAVRPAGGDPAGPASPAPIGAAAGPGIGSHGTAGTPGTAGAGGCAGAVSTSPAWRAAATTVERGLRDGRRTLVLGEPGSGRTSLLMDLFAGIRPGGRVVVLTPDAVRQDPAAAAARLRLPGPDLPVLRDVDRLPPAAVRSLIDALAGAPPVPAPLAATATPDWATADEPLLALFDASATVPPLRARTGDLGDLTTRLLARIAPHRDVRLSPEVMRVLARHDWPGNVSELADALAAALHRRPVGRIEVGDLPASCQSTPRAELRTVDRVERDAIVGALRDSGGNRVAAAAALGLARSTLYRKIRQYGITT